MSAINLVYALARLKDQWAREDFELSDARSQLMPAQRTNEAEEDKRISRSRKRQAKQIIERELGIKI